MVAVGTETLRLSEVLAYLDEAESALLAEIARLGDRLHVGEAGQWSPAQIVRHLVWTEGTIYLLWWLVPPLRRWPRAIALLDRGNAALWRAMGMRTVRESPLAGNPLMGRYRAPVFLRPRGGGVTAEALVRWRGRMRQRTMQAALRLDEDTLRSLGWSHPLLGRFSLLEFLRFLGLHEWHHVAQLRRMR